MRNQNGSSGKKMNRRMMLLLLILLFAVIAFVTGNYLETHNRTQARGVIQENIGLYESITYQGVTYVQKPAMKTYLLMGIDRSSTEQSFGARQGGQADFLMVIAVDHENKTIYQLHIDRDTMTDVQVYGILGNELGTRIMQICLAHGYGTTQEQNDQNAVEAVQTLLQGNMIDDYIALDLEAIGILNDMLGGVTVTLADDFTAYDPLMTKGATLRLNATQAEIYTRYRLEVGDGSNESRMARQRTFLQSAGALLKEQLTNQPDFLEELLSGLQDVMTTNLSKNQLLREINVAYNYEINSAETLPGQHTVGDDGYMEFYIEDDAVTQWLLRTYYNPENPTAGT